MKRNLVVISLLPSEKNRRWMSFESEIEISEALAVHVNHLRLALDTSVVEAQMEKVVDPLTLHFPDLLADDITCRFPDVIVGDCESAVGADGTVEVCNTLRFRPDFDDFLAALR